MQLAIEGIDGSGKGAQTRLLDKRLRGIRHIYIIPSVRPDQEIKPQWSVYCDLSRSGKCS